MRPEALDSLDLALQIVVISLTFFPLETKRGFSVAEICISFSLYVCLPACLSNCLSVWVCILLTAELSIQALVLSFDIWQ